MHPSRWLTATLVLAAAVSALLALALHVQVPVVSFVAGYSLTSGPLIALAVLAVTALVLLRGRLARRRGAIGSHWFHRALAVILALALVGIAQPLMAQASFAEDAGVKLDVAATVWSDTIHPEPDATVAYLRTAHGESLPASIWRARGRNGAAPVVIMVHGGGWVGGSRLHQPTVSHAQWLAEEGYTVIDIDYSLSTTTSHLWQTDVEQVGCAMSWAAANAGAYGGDAHHLALVGDSAGGELALDAAYRGNAGRLVSPCPTVNHGVIPHVSAVSTLYAPAYPGDWVGTYDPYYSPLAASMATRYTGGTPAQFPRRYAAITAADNVTASAPPTLLVNGADDHLVNAAVSDRIGAVLTAAHVPHEILTEPFADHVLDARPGDIGSQVWRARTLALFRQYLG